MTKFLTFIIIIVGSRQLLSETRKIALPTINFESIHGGAYRDGSGRNKSCFASDLFYYNDLDLELSNKELTVKMVRQTVSVLLRNISDVSQTVSIILKKNSSVFWSHTDGVLEQAPVASTGKAFSVNSDWISPPTSLLPGDSRDFSFRIDCDAKKCGLFFNGNLILGNSVSGPEGGCENSPMQICMVQDLRMELEVQVNEIKGGLTGSMVTWAHRCGGLNDKILKNFSYMPIRSGRIF